MNDIKTYLNILIESLDKKSKVLNDILELTKKQQQVINKEELDLDEFEKIMDQKQKFIEEIGIIDSGFQSTYDRIKDNISTQLNLYKDEIILLKQKITQTSEIGISIQVLEEKNKQNIENHFKRSKNKVKTFKKSRTSVANYYKNMNKLHENQSYFLDKKN
ncbi:MAG: flagellar protein FlgN [Vallitalea sp.]|jgi:flagellar biosynthesis/type III secretory pathway chaperone|nr:flagellar protein FlgN [Vallitalea sp.]